jgi:hypothetical protein
VPLATAGWLFLVDLFLGVANASSLEDVKLLAPSGEGNRRAILLLRRVGLFRSAVFSLFLLCAGVCCIPQKLIEFRYFVPCVVTAMTSGRFFSLCRRANYARYAHVARLLDAVAAVTVHMVCCLVFLYRPFTAPDGSVGRFMW